MRAFCRTFPNGENSILSVPGCQFPGSTVLIVYEPENLEFCKSKALNFRKIWLYFAQALCMSLQKGMQKVKILEKAFIPLFLVIAMLASCNGFTSAPASSPTTSTIVTETLAANPTATFTDTPSPLLSPLPPTDTSLPTSGKIVYYYFVDIAKDVPP